MIFVWMLAGSAMAAGVIPQLDTRFYVLYYVIPAVIWNVVSSPRIGRAYWLHLSPYATVAGLYMVTWGLSASEGQYAFGGHSPTAVDAAIFYSGLPLLLVWPVATISLCARRGDR